MATPTPLTWTIRFKSRKTTVVLHVDPLNNFATIKSYLFSALKETTLKDSETGASISLPTSPSDFQLGRPIDLNHDHAGFRVGEWEYTTAEEEDETSKGKGKAKPKPNATTKSGPAIIKDCLKGAGLKDGAVLAFRWKGDGIWDGGDGDMDIDQVATGDAAEACTWGVKLASFEDAYGVENETDVGGGREFEG